MNKLYISYNIRYSPKNKTAVKDLVNNIVDRILIDDDYKKQIVTSKRKINNKPKVRKAVKIILLNLIFSVQVKRDLIISLDDHILYKNDISPKIFRFVIDWLKNNDFIRVVKGNFSKSQVYNKRTIIKVEVDFMQYVIMYIFDLNIKKLASVTNRIIDKMNKLYIVTFTTECDKQNYIYKTADKKLATDISVNHNKIFEVDIDKNDEVINFRVLK